MNYPEDHPLNTDTLGQNEDGSYDVIVRMTVRLRDEVALRAEPHMLEHEHENGVDNTSAVIGMALAQHLIGTDTNSLIIEKGHTFTVNGGSGYFQNPRTTGGA